MKQICEIGKKISPIKKRKLENEIDGAKYAEKMFEVLRPYASEYKKLEFEYGLFPEYYRHRDSKRAPEPLINIENGIIALSKHPFVTWFNSQSGIIQAREKIANEKLIVICDPGIEAIKKYRNSHALEFICTSFIHYFTNDNNKLTQIPVTKEKLKSIETAMRKLKHELTKGGGLYFFEESKQYLLQYLLDERINDDRQNIYTSKKIHNHILRQLLTKKIAQCLFIMYGLPEISNAFVVDIALDISSVFFDNPMDRGDAISMTKNIHSQIIQDNTFKEQTIGSLLAKRGLELMNFSL